MGRQCASAVGRSHCSAADKAKKKSQGDAPEGEEESRREKRKRRSPMASELTGDAYRWAGLRRGISRWLVDVFEGEQREMREGSRGI
jgi:hypothetical protein